MENKIFMFKIIDFCLYTVKIESSIKDLQEKIQHGDGFKMN